MSNYGWPEESNDEIIAGLIKTRDTLEAECHKEHDKNVGLTDRIRALEADRDQLSLTLAVAKADRDKWFNRARDLEAALRSVNATMRAIIKRNQGGYIGDWDAIHHTVEVIDAALASTPETEAQHIDRLALAGCTCPMYEKLHRSGCPAIDVPKNRQVETKVEQPEVGYPEPGPFPGPTDRGRRSW